MADRRFPPAVWLLGWVSLLTDAASEAIYPLLPFFLTTVLGGGPVALGIIEGVAEGTNSLLRIVSGRLSDRSSRRRRLVIAGYTLVVRRAAARRARLRVVAGARHPLYGSGREGRAQRTARRAARVLGRPLDSRARLRIPSRDGSRWRGHRPTARDRVSLRGAGAVPRAVPVDCDSRRDRGPARVARTGCGCVPGRARRHGPRDPSGRRTRRGCRESRASPGKVLRLRRGCCHFHARQFHRCLPAAYA